MRSLRALVPLVLAFAAFPLAAQSASGTAQCVLLEVSGGGIAPRVIGGVPHFSATQTIDLTLRLHMSQSLSGSHVVQHRLFTPTRSLYQAIDLPIVDPVKGEAKQRALAGYPFPVKEQKPARASAAGVSTWLAQAAFPVGGTHVVSNGLYGTWSVQAMLDGFAKPLCSASFAIDP